MILCVEVMKFYHKHLRLPAGGFQSTALGISIQLLGHIIGSCWITHYPPTGYILIKQALAIGVLPSYIL